MKKKHFYPHNRVRIGLIGLDHWYGAEFIAKLIAENDEVELVASWHHDREKARDILPDTSIELANDWHSIIKRDDIDAIASFVTVDENVDVVITAANEGKHILSVKPVAMSVEKIDLVMPAIKDKDIVFFPMEGFYRLSPHCLKMHELLSERRLGEILRISVIGRHALPSSWPGHNTPGWFGDPERVPGGAWLDHAIYQIALIRWLLGAEAKSVWGETRNLVSSEKIANEDYGLAVFTFSNDTIVSVEATWTLPPDLNYYQLDVVGTKGMMSYASRDMKLWILEKDGWIEEAYGVEPADPVQHFVDIIRGTAQPICTIEDARADLLCCLTFYEAAKLGEEMKIE